AQQVAGYIPIATRVLDVGCGAMALERHLPFGCAYVPADMVRRDDRTLLCDLEAGRFPAAPPVDLITLLGVLEYVGEDRLGAVLDWLRTGDAPALITYSATDYRPDRAERARLGWTSHLDRAQLLERLRAHGLAVEPL